ncbi:MAG: HAD-IIA family hydrolase [Actinomycetota bacterium]
MIDADGLLLDLDGTVVLGGQPVAGAPEAIRAVRQRGIPYRFATNATATTRTALAAHLTALGIETEPGDILTAPVVTAAYLRSHHPDARCLLLGEGGAAEDLEGVELVMDRADVVIVAGADRAYTWENLTHAYRMILDGAAIVAMHRNLAWRTEDGLTLDAGAFLVGLERAAGVEATVIGKPSEAFFRQAVELLGTPPERTAIIGDDLDNDVLAAQDLGLTGVLVRTGKFRPEMLDASARKPDHVIDSIADLSAVLG